MKKWMTPIASVEEFEANEYVAVCYSVVCTVDAANTVEQSWMLERPWWQGGPISNYAAGQTHSATACGALGNYYATDVDGNGLIDSLTEYSRDQGALACTLYTDSSYQTTAGWNTVSAGSGTIYWTTSSADGSRTWHHQGTVSVADASHPNRS